MAKKLTASDGHYAGGKGINTNSVALNNGPTGSHCPNLQAGVGSQKTPDTGSEPRRPMRKGGPDPSAGRIKVGKG